jgi:hypothetical protein
MSDLPPRPESPPVDPRTGQWSPEWLRWIARLEQIVRGLS